MTAARLYLTWLNPLGGFDYFFFTAKNAYNVEVEESGTMKNNLLPNWPKSYGNTADTILRQTFRTSRNKIIVRSQHLTRNQLEALTYMRTSPLVQHMLSRNDKRTLIVDPDSFKKYDELEDLFTFQFTAIYTDEIPSQRV